MKKMLLLLLVTILSVGALNGMEQLPKDIHHEIVRKAIASSNTLEDAIKAVNVASALQGVRYDNLKDFTRLVHLLADKFNMSTRPIAYAFNTSVAKIYLQLADMLMDGISITSSNLEQVSDAIKKGADVNYLGNSNWTPLHKAVQDQNVAIVKLLLDSGANPNVRSEGKTALDNIEKAIIWQTHQNFVPSLNVSNQIKQLLKEAMSKQ